MKFGCAGYMTNVMPTASDMGTEPATEVLSMREVTCKAMLGGRYELGRVIGRGGMSTVYEAFDHRTGARVAVKVFRPGVELADSPARRSREVQLASAVRHPGLAAVLDAQLEDSDRFDGCTFLVTELVDGSNLGERLRLAPLSERDAVELGAALCSALAAIHDAGIIHRDIKPANVLLPSGDDGPLHPILVDFGIALMIDSTRMTGTGFMAGTANYLSPEQVQGQSITPASDIYSLGLVLIEVVRGTPVFAGSGIEAAVARLTADPVPPRHLDPRLAQLLARMTDRIPSNRPTAQSTANQLLRLLGGGLASDIFAIDVTPPATRSRRPAIGLRGKQCRRGALIAGLVAAGALMTGLTMSSANSAHGRGTPQTPPPAAAAAPSTTRPTTSPTQLHSAADTPSVSTAEAPPVSGPKRAVVAVNLNPTQRSVQRADTSTPNKSKGKKGKGHQGGGD